MKNDLHDALRAGTLVEVLVTMILSGILLLAVYDGLDIVRAGMEMSDDSEAYDALDWLEHYEILEFRSDSVRTEGQMNIFYMDGVPSDTLVNYGL